MKTKLTLTVNKRIIDKAKKLAKQRRVSVSRLFEEVFEQDQPQPIRSEKQKAAMELLKSLEQAPTIKSDKRSDKEMIKEYVSRKHS